MKDLMSETTHPSQRLLRLNAVLARVPVSRSAWYAGVAAGIYPRPVKLGAKTVAWPESAINRLIQELSTQ